MIKMSRYHLEVCNYDGNQFDFNTDEELIKFLFLTNGDKSKWLLFKKDYDSFWKDFWSDNLNENKRLGE